MDKKHTTIVPENSEMPEENSDESSSENTKRSIKNRLWRLLMITDIKDKKLKPKLKEIKDEMYATFCRTWVREAEYVDRMFRIYANIDQDIRIFKPQFALFSQYPIHVKDVPTEESLKITQYMKTLRFIRNGLNWFMQHIKYMSSLAKDHAKWIIQSESTDEMFNTDYERETEAEKFRALAKKHLKHSMETVLPWSQQKYDWDWFVQEKNIIADTFEDNNYQDLMKFAMLWFHYFDKKSDVYDAFMPEQLSMMIHFTVPGFRPTAISLREFLNVIEHLNFKKHLFSF